MKILLVADLHIDQRDDLWVNQMDSTFAFICNEIEDQGVDHVFLLGDLIDTPHHVKTIALCLLSKGIRQITSKLPATGHLVILRGNHDLLLRKGVTVNNLSWLKGYSKVLLVTEEPLRYPPFLMVPFYSNNEEWLEAVKKHKSNDTTILMAHQPIAGLFFANATKDEDGVPLAKIPFNKIFNGHYHTPQTTKGKKKIRVVGSPMGMDFRDEVRGRPPRGITLLEMAPKAKGGLQIGVEKHLPNPYAVHYHTCHYDDLVPGYLPAFEGGAHPREDFTHIRVRVPAHKTADLKEYMEGREFASWEPQIEREAAPLRQDVSLDKKAPKDVIPEYVGKFFTDKERKEEAVKVGLALLKGEYSGV